MAHPPPCASKIYVQQLPPPPWDAEHFSVFPCSVPRDALLGPQQQPRLSNRRAAASSTSAHCWQPGERGSSAGVLLSGTGERLQRHVPGLPPTAPIYDTTQFALDRLMHAPQGHTQCTPTPCTSPRRT